jgi:hypothetical protein
MNPVMFARLEYITYTFYVLTFYNVKIVVYYNSSGLKLHRQLKCAQTFWMIALRCLIQHKRLGDNIQLHTDVANCTKRSLYKQFHSILLRFSVQSQNIM